jgi:hypothetical protein
MTVPAGPATPPTSGVASPASTVVRFDVGFDPAVEDALVRLLVMLRGRRVRIRSVWARDCRVDLDIVVPADRCAILERQVRQLVYVVDTSFWTYV